MTFIRCVATVLIGIVAIVACSGSEPDGTAAILEAELNSVKAERDQLRKDINQVNSELGSATAERDRAQHGLRRAEADLSSAVAGRDGIVRRLDVVTAERDEAQQDLQLAGSDLSSMAAERDSLAESLAVMEAQRDGLLSDQHDQELRIADLDAELKGAHELVEQVEQEIQFLLSKYDKEIRADLETAVDVEIERACAAAIEPDMYESPISRIVRWQPEWEPVTTREDVELAVVKCAEPGRAELRTAALDAEVEEEKDRACRFASRHYEQPIGSIIRWNSEWEEVTTRAKLEQSVETCAESERERLAAERRSELLAQVNREVERSCDEAAQRRSREPIVLWRAEWEAVTSRVELETAAKTCVEERRAAFYADCDRIDIDQIKKNVTSYRGVCLVMYGYIFQFDNWTGKCSFGAYVSRNRSTRWYDYDSGNVSFFGYRDDYPSSTIVGSCPELDDIDEDDFVKLWATSMGSYEYTSTVDREVNALYFRIEKVEIVRKN